MSNSALHRHTITLLAVVALLGGAVVFSMDVAILVGVFAFILTIVMVLFEPIRKRAEERLREQRKAELRAMRRGGSDQRALDCVTAGPATIDTKDF